MNATPTVQYVTLYPDLVNHFGVENLIHQHRLRSCLFVYHNMAARGPAENSVATNLLCTTGTGVQMRGEQTTQITEKQDADICKRSDTDLEKASSSGWLVNRGVKLPCGSQSMGKSPAH